MNIHNEEQEASQNPAYNPFPEPQTIPSGWDLSGIFSIPQVSSEMVEEDTEKG